MRAFVLLVAAALLCSGCAGAQPPPAPPDEIPAPLRSAERTLPVEIMPGEPPAAWPVAIVEAAGRYLLPWRDDLGLHARLVGPDGTIDVPLGSGVWLGAAPLGDRFAVVIAFEGAVAMHVLDGVTHQVDWFALSGQPVPAVASDGARVLVVTQGDPIDEKAEVHALVAGDAGGVQIDLGLASPSPPLYGDGDGFIVDQHFTVDALGAVGRTPSAQVPGARLFRQATPNGDEVTLDGGAWLAVGAPVLSATRDPAGIELVLPDDSDGRRLQHVVADLTRAAAPLEVPRSPSVPGFVRGVAGDRVLWEAVVQSDHVFAGLDRATLASAGWWVRVPAPSSRTVAVAFGASSFLLAWIDADRRYVFARMDGG
jgi:hypothetical protein